MSVLEKKGKGKLDDTVPLKCIIESFLNIDGHTVSTGVFVLEYMINYKLMSVNILHNHIP